ncbi:MAG: hypothetical protein D6760_08395 [Deltaproteobacteria bacterium]|nr:MAG: hypothetical protein D6760_08395 [Deltaproteobacteria bacterium]
MSHPRPEGAAGALAGTRVGDALGGVVESLDPAQIEHRWGGRWDGLKPAAPGAASEMTCAVARSLADFPDFNGADMARRLVDACTPERGYGRGTLAAIDRLRRGTPWREAAIAPGGRTSFGNGAAVRAAPVGLAYCRDAEALRWVAEEQAGITHAHALACEGAVLHAHAVALALVTAGRSIDGPGFLLDIGREAQMREFRSRYETAARLAARGSRPDRVVSNLGNGTSALGSVVTAAYCFAASPDDFSGAVCLALALGGNARSIASMTGALAGARLGTGGIPPAWLAACDADEPRASTMAELGRRLLSGHSGRSRLGTGGRPE